MAEILENMQPEDEESTVVTLTDLDDGSERDFELIGEYETDGKHYYALVPIDDADDADEYYIFRGTEDENGDITFETIEDDSEFEAIEDYFNDALFSEVDCDAEMGEDAND